MDQNEACLRTGRRCESFRARFDLRIVHIVYSGMRPVEVKFNVYSVQELREQFPEGFKRAHERLVQSDDGQHTCDEVFASLKATVAAFGASLKDWCIGAYSRSYVKVDGDDDVLALSHNRAWAKYEKAVAPHRIPWSGPRRREVAKYGTFYRPDMVEPCPFTGVCYDDDMLESIRKDLRGGCTLRDALRNLADTAQGILEREAEARATEEYFVEYATDNGTEFRADGSEHFEP